MQLVIPPSAEIFSRVENAMQTERLLRYMPAAGKDKTAAFSLYMWNCCLCEAFFVPMHFAEIVCRNAIHNRFISRFGLSWYHNATFFKVMDQRFSDELLSVMDEEVKQHHDGMTAHHIVSALTFAFWQHLLTKRFERMLWMGDGLKESFPNIPNRIGRQDLHDTVESVRRWRNRIAHHQAIFDKGPMAKHQEAINIIRWACGDTGNCVSSISKVPVAISLRPR